MKNNVWLVRSMKHKRFALYINGRLKEEFPLFDSDSASFLWTDSICKEYEIEPKDIHTGTVSEDYEFYYLDRYGFFDENLAVVELKEE